MSRSAENVAEEAETHLTEEEWVEAKRLALRLIQAERLDAPASHLAYIREKIRVALAEDVV